MVGDAKTGQVDFEIIRKILEDTVRAGETMLKTNCVMNKLIVLASLILLIGCGPSEEEKQAALDSFIEENYVMPDTVIRFALDTNTLTLEFTNKSGVENWITEVWIEGKDDSKVIHLGSSAKEPLVDNKLVYAGFHIPAEELKNYSPRFFGFPDLEDVVVISNPFENIRIMYTKQDSSENVLSPDEYSRSLRYVKFNMHALDSLSPELVEYCALQAIEKFNFDPTGTFEPHAVDIENKE